MTQRRVRAVHAGRHRHGHTSAQAEVGRLALYTAATYQELLDCNHSKAHNCTEEWERSAGLASIGGGGPRNTSGHV